MWVSRSFASMAPPRPDPKTGWMVTPPTYGAEPFLEHRPDLAVVDAQCRGHRQGGEHPGLQPRQGQVLVAPQIGTAMMAGGLGARPVVLEVDLDPFTVLPEQREERVVVREP